MNQYNSDGLLECLFLNIDITDSDSTSIAESKITDSEIIVFPNPTNNILNIYASAEISRMLLYDINGRVAYSCENCSQAQINGVNKINVSTFSQGIYVLKVESGKEQFFKQISISRQP